MDPEIASAFWNSQNVSIQNGISGHLMKSSAKRRRTKGEIEDAKMETIRKQQEIDEKLAVWKQMEAALESSEKQITKMRRQSESMRQIYDDGLIKKADDGGYQIVESPEEREQIKATRSKPKKRGNIEPMNYDDVSVDLDLQEGDLN